MEENKSKQETPVQSMFYAPAPICMDYIQWCFSFKLGMYRPGVFVVNTKKHLMLQRFAILSNYLL
jgi:hypothetical protein